MGILESPFTSDVGNVMTFQMIVACYGTDGPPVDRS
jgi:hypothetical protein